MKSTDRGNKTIVKEKLLFGDKETKQQHVECLLGPVDE
jgi:hypothetical protein